MTSSAILAGCALATTARGWAQASSRLSTQPITSYHFEKRIGLYGLLRSALVALALPAMLAACRPEAEPVAPEGRPVRTVVVEKREAGETIALTGRIESDDEVALAFRISGRMIENDVKLGDRVQAGQVVARLEPQNELNALRAAQANLAAAQGQLTQARNNFQRQDTLLKQG
jgi:multidrug efflux pump subunit AcrA (membrane-fusion protein)